MRKVVFYSSALIMIAAFCFLFFLKDRGMFIVQFLTSVLSIICFPKCKEQYHFTIIVFLSVWVAMINVVYMVLLLCNAGSAFVGSQLGLMIQFGIPFIVTMILRAINIKRKNS